jgi:peptide/nickel transport system substrate-binding protein
MKKLIVVLLVTFLLFSCFGCIGSQTGSKEVVSSDSSAGSVEATGSQSIPEDVDRPLIVGLDNDLINLDPSGSQAYAPGQVLTQIFDTLFSFDENMKFQGNLAESWEYEDDLTLVVKLKEGVKFSNGEELTADDVIYSYQRSKYMPNSAMQFELYDDVNSYAADKYTVKLKTTRPYSPQPYKFVWVVTSIVNKKAVEATGGEVTEESCIGTGPYKLVKWYPGDRVELTANEYYREEGLPKTKNLTFRVIIEANSRAMAVESGDIDIAYKISAADAKRFAESDTVVLHRALGLNTCFLGFNCQKAPFDNQKLRQAIFHAINREAAVSIGFGGAGEVAQTFFPSDIEGAAPDIGLPEYNVEKAKQLLAEAGYPNGLEFTLICQAANENRRNMATFIQAQLAEVGITVKIDAVEQGVFTDTYVGGLHDTIILGWTDVSGEPAQILDNWDYRNESLFTTWGYKNDTYSDYLKIAVGSVDKEVVNENFRKCQEILHADVPAIPIVVAYLDEASTREVQGFVIDRSWECMNLEYVYFG